VADHWVNAHLLRGQAELRKREFGAALTDFEAAQKIPENLPTDREGGRSIEIAYWRGLAHDGLGDAAKARESWQGAASAEAPASRRRAENRLSERQIQTCYQALAKRRLGDISGAEEVFRNLQQTANKAIEASSTSADPGSHSRPDSTLALAHYLAGLCQLGLDDRAQAKSQFQSALDAAPDFLGAKSQLDILR
jgi:tetratricopeptide (TPR) repeat protein